MLESVTIFMLGLATLFTILMVLINWDTQPQCGFFGILGFATWFVNAAMIVSVDVPYTVITSADAVTSGVHQVTANIPLSYLFIGLGFVCLGYTIFSVVGYLINVWGKK